MAREIDARGMLCPKPVILTKKELDDMKEDERLLTIVDNEAARINMSKLYSNLGYEFEVEEKDGYFYIEGIKGKTLEGKNEKESGEISNRLSQIGDNTVILFDKDKLGHGNDELGGVLIKGFLYTLTEFKNKPKTLIFLNGGVKLTTEGSDVVLDIEKLEKEGVEIYSCGTCLDYYNLADKLKVGEVTNMYTIAEKLLNASNTIKL
ncbi:MAG: sulfurtransferase-like selenium metabolism protein YedF [Andreesenia angusta]|nr:sulfurtransferase-like selenium metabolism protein YedF [Andreesenia angusta]